MNIYWPTKLIYISRPIMCIMKTVEYRAEGYASLTRTVVSGGTSGRVNVPKNWIGKRAIVILLEPILEQKE